MLFRIKFDRNSLSEKKGVTVTEDHCLIVLS